MAKRSQPEIEETTCAPDTDAQDDLDFGELVIELPPDFAEQLELAQRPPLEPGEYLATILAVESKVTDKGTHASKGLNWKLVINSDPEAVSNGWNPDARGIPYTHYTYIGKIINGSLTDTDKGGPTRDMALALGIDGSFKLSAVKNRLITVVVIHEPSQDDQIAQRQDPTHEVERWFIRVKKVKSYIVNGIRGPLNDYLSDGSEPSTAASPNW